MRLRGGEHDYSIQSFRTCLLRRERSITSSDRGVGHVRQLWFRNYETDISWVVSMFCTARKQCDVTRLCVILELPFSFRKVFPSRLYVLTIITKTENKMC